MSNYLKMPKKSQVLALLELGWGYRRIEAATGVRRETVSGYDRLRLANAAKTFPGSDRPPPTESADRPDVEGANAAKTFAGSDPKPSISAIRSSVGAGHPAARVSGREMKTAQRLLLDLARRLETEHPSAAESVREGLDETLTVLTLKLSPRLRRSLATTNAAESLISRTRSVKRNVKRWRAAR